MGLQGSAERIRLGLVNFVIAFAYHFCLSLPAVFTQPGRSLLANLVYLLRFGEITLDRGRRRVGIGEGQQRAMIDFHSSSPSCVTLGAIHKGHQLNFWDSWLTPPYQYQIHATSLLLVRFWPTSLPTEIIYEWPHAFFLFLSHPPTLPWSIHPSTTPPPSHFIYLSTSIRLSLAPPTDGLDGGAICDKRVRNLPTGCPVVAENVEWTSIWNGIELLQNKMSKATLSPEQ